MTFGAAALVLGGALAGGFISGLTGFGTGLVALGIWLHAVEPAQAAALVVACSVAAQAQTLPAVWHAVDGRRLAPMLAAGLVGVPLGAMLLPRVDPAAFRLGVGALLLLFCAAMAAGWRRRGEGPEVKEPPGEGRPAGARGTRAMDAAVGLGGGVLGGLTGLSGPLPIMWATLQGWDKDRRRGVFQGYNAGVLGLTLLAHAVSGLLTAEFGRLFLLALPGTFLGAQAGLRVYRRVSDRGFDRLIVAILGCSGLTLLLAGGR